MIKIIIVLGLFGVVVSCALSQAAELEIVSVDGVTKSDYVSERDSLHHLFLEELAVITQTLDFEFIGVSETDSTYVEELRNKVIYYTIILDDYEAIAEVVCHEKSTAHIAMITKRFEELLKTRHSKSVQFVSINKVYGENSFNAILVYDANGVIKYYNAF